MKGRAIALVALIAALALVLPMTASAHDFSVTPRINISKIPKGATAPGERVIVTGKIKSKSLCRRHRAVSLYEVKPGRDDRLATDRSDNEGEFGFRLHPTADLDVYAKIKRLAKRTYNHHHVCRRARSDKLSIDVSG